MNTKKNRGIHSIKILSVLLCYVVLMGFLPTAALTIPVCLVLFGAVRRIHAEFKIDNGVV